MKYVLESQKEWDFEVKMETYAPIKDYAEAGQTLTSKQQLDRLQKERIVTHMLLTRKDVKDDPDLRWRLGAAEDELT